MQLNGSHTGTLSTGGQTSGALASQILFFLSLSFSLAGALLAILVKQWARNYLDETTRRPESIQRARIRSYLHAGVQRFRLALLINVIPTLLHISLLLFFGGLYRFFFPVNHVVGYLALAGFVICGSIYLILTLAGTLVRHCPYQTPLSTLFWYGIRLIRLLFCRKPGPNGDFYANPTEEMECIAMLGLKRILGDAALSGHGTDAEVNQGYIRPEWKVDLEALRWTVDNFNDNDEFEPFVAGIPSFLAAEDLSDPLGFLRALIRYKNLDLERRVFHLLHSSNKLGPLHRERRARVCLDAIWYFTCARLLPRQDGTMAPGLGGNWLTFTESLQCYLLDDDKEVVQRATSILLLLVCAQLRDLDIMDSRDKVSNLRSRRIHFKETMGVLDDLLKDNPFKPSTMDGSFKEQWSHVSNMQELISLKKAARLAVWSMLLIYLRLCPPLTDFIFHVPSKDPTRGSIAKPLIMGLNCCATSDVLQRCYVDAVASDRGHKRMLDWSVIAEQSDLLVTVDDVEAVQKAIRILEKSDRDNSQAGEMRIALRKKLKRFSLSVVS